MKLNKKIIRSFFGKAGLVLMLMLALCFSLAACSGEEKNETPDPQEGGTGIVKKEAESLSPTPTPTPAPTATPEPTPTPVPDPRDSLELSGTYWVSEGAYGETDGWFVDLIIREDRTASFRASQSGRTGMYGMIDLYDLTYGVLDEPYAYAFTIDNTMDEVLATLDANCNLLFYIYPGTDPIVFTQAEYPEEPLAPIVGQVYGNWNETWYGEEDYREEISYYDGNQVKVSFEGTMQMKIDWYSNGMQSASNTVMMEVSEEDPLSIGAEWTLYGRYDYSSEDSFSDGIDNITSYVEYYVTLSAEDELLIYRNYYECNEEGETEYCYLSAMGFERDNPSKLRSMNNGEYFIKVGDKVYFRAYGDDALAGTALFADFINSPTGEGVSCIKYFDESDCMIYDAFEDYGFGKLFYMNGCFYLTRIVSANNYSSYELYSISPDGTNEFILDDDILSICGVSEDRNAIAYTGYKNGKTTAVVCVDDSPVFEKADDEFYYSVLCINSEYVIFSGTEASSTYSDGNTYLFSYEFATGTERNLGAVVSNDEYYSTMTGVSAVLVDDTVYAVFEVRDGSAWVYQCGGVYAADCREENSIYLFDECTSYIDTPIVVVDGEGVYVSEHPYEEFYIGSEGELCVRRNGYDEAYSTSFVPATFKNSAVVVDTVAMTRLRDTLYFRVDYSVEDPSENVGWRSAYRHTATVHYRFELNTYKYWTFEQSYYNAEPIDAMCWLTDSKSTTDGGAGIVFQEWSDASGEYGAVTYYGKVTYARQDMTYVSETGECLGYNEFMEDLKRSSSKKLKLKADEYGTIELPSEDSNYASGFYRMYLDELGYIYYAEKLW